MPSSTSNSHSHRRPTDRIKQIMAANAATGMGHQSAASAASHGGANSESAKQKKYVYVMDGSYSWLPARVVSVDLPGEVAAAAAAAAEAEAEGGGGETGDAAAEWESLQRNGCQNEAAAAAGATATVTVVLPRDWRDQTVLQDGTDGDLEELELLSQFHGSATTAGRFSESGLGGSSVSLAAAAAAGGDDGSTVMTGMTGHSRRSRMPDDSTAGPRVQRTVRLSDYPAGVLPLQNVDRRGRLLGKSDMADLPHLHEPAILYNLKERHGRGVPYTRVGDIVVAMNPFRWIDGLYSSERRNFYSDHLIWNRADGDQDQDDDGDGDKGFDAVDAAGNAEESGQAAAAAATSVEAKKYKSDYDRLGYDPHVYETSCLAYRGLAMEKRNQTILVSGESGAGKTETVKIVMSHLATVERTRPNYHATAREHDNAESASGTVRRVLESNPVFEAFGNAKTVRNDNSSRFGKFTRLQFDVEASSSARAHRREVPACLLAGSICTTYLLEKSRVVGQAPGERNYHIFYQLLAAPEDVKTWIWDGLGGTSPESFACVGESEVDGIEGRTDAEWWDRTAAALGVFGVEKEELRDTMRALCVVMQLGNLTFDLDPDEEHQDQAVVTSEDDLDLLADVMGVPAKDISEALTVRTMKMRGEEIKSGLTPADAREGRDALAKDLYARLFDLLVSKMNDYTRAEANHVPSSSDGRGGAAKRNKFREICLLDIFGFEKFETNRFEQLCINYANEKLQHRYAVDIFAETKEEYEAEGIELFDFSKVDNSGVLELLEGRMGLITSLNEECKRPKGNDAAFVYRIKTMHADSQHLIQQPLDLATEFGIQHFAGAVTYDASNFVERNTDKLPQDLLECACKSTNKTIQREFRELASSVQDAMAGAPRKGGATTKHTVITTFKKQLTDLMASIEKTKTRYIRCIKPNHHMDPGVTNHAMTMAQLQSAGLVTAIAITRESFPDRLAYDTVMERFKVLVPADEMKRSGTSRERSDFLLMKLYNITAPHDMPYALGKTKVYFRAGALERLESIRLEYFSSRAIVIQTWARLIMAGKRYEEMRFACIAIQARGRAHLEAKAFRKKQRAAVILQCAVRCLFAVWELEWRRENRAVTVIQSQWRMINHRRYYIETKHSACIIQRCYRTKRNQAILREKLAELLENARMENRLAQLQEQVHVLSPEADVDADMIRDLKQPMDEGMMQEVDSMFDYLRKEISDLRAENELLQADANAFDEENRELSSSLQAAQAASQVTKSKLGGLEKTNEELHLEVNSSKAKVAELKKELKAQGEVRAQDVDAMCKDYEKAIADRDAEIRKLKGDLKASKRALRMEREMLTDEVERVQEEHLAEIMRLKNELKKTRDSHHDYLAKLMDVLETTHATREEETAKLNSELQALQKAKDTEVSSLQEELKSLRLRNGAQSKVATQEKAEKNFNREVSTLKEQINKNAADRKEREFKFRKLSEALDDEISLIERPTKMQQMMWTLKDIYKSEQASHVSVEQETLRMSEKLGLAPAADYAGSNKKMAQTLKATRDENQYLREQLARLTARNSSYNQAPPGRRSTASPSRTAGRLSTSSESRPQQQMNGRGVGVDRDSSRRRLQQVRNSQQKQQAQHNRSLPPQTQNYSQQQHKRQSNPRSSIPVRQSVPPSSTLASGSTSRRNRPIARIGQALSMQKNRRRLSSGDDDHDDGHHL